MSKFLKHPSIQAAMLASRFARECELPAGNLWEPGIARAIERDLIDGETLENVERHWRFQLGLTREATTT